MQRQVLIINELFYPISDMSYLFETIVTVFEYKHLNKNKPYIVLPQLLNIKTLTKQTHPYSQSIITVT